MTTYNTRCADCGYDTIEGGQWYMVRDAIWERAWGHIERSAPGQQILCIWCLEKRIGRTLTMWDFTDAPVNSPFQGEPDVSETLFDRLIAKQPLVNDRCSLEDYLAWRDISRLPEDKREAAWLAWKNSEGSVTA